MKSFMQKKGITVWAFYCCWYYELKRKTAGCEIFYNHGRECTSASFSDKLKTLSKLYFPSLMLSWDSGYFPES